MLKKKKVLGLVSVLGAMLAIAFGGGSEGGTEEKESELAGT